MTSLITCLKALSPNQSYWGLEIQLMNFRSYTIHSVTKDIKIRVRVRDTQFDGLIGLIAMSIPINNVKNVNSACKSLGKNDTVLGPSRKGSLWELCLILADELNPIVRKEGKVGGLKQGVWQMESEHVSMHTGKS